ncbi:MAG: VUT family protein, partial [Cyclobacteriaceae bacterium]
VVLFIAFSGIFSTSQIIAIGITNYIYKFLVAVALTPLIYAGHYAIDKYLGREHAQRISDAASDDSQSFF